MTAGLLDPAGGTTLEPRLDLRQDGHVHTTFSADGVSTPAACVAAAARARLRRICLSDHADRAGDWEPRLVSEVQRLRTTVDLEILAGVETKILDAQGRLDLPAATPPLDRVLVADHRFPAPDGPIDAGVVASDLRAGRTSTRDVVAGLVRATAAALTVAEPRCARPVIAHLFSLLPKIGMSEDDVDGDLLDELVAAAATTGAILDVSERWYCPSVPVVARFLAAGVEVVPGSGAHAAAAVGHHPHADQVIVAATAMAASGGAASAGPAAAR